MVAVQWYPGHMDKARRDMQESLKAVDLVIEVRDARIPDASRNPMLDQMIQSKARLIILSKTDLADPKITDQWLKALEHDSQKAIAVDLASDTSAKSKILSLSAEMTQAKYDKMVARGILHPRAMRAMACGIPNVGKSTLINRIAGKSTAKTEDRPGVTRSLNWIHASRTLDVLDTPGVLWPKFEDQDTGIKLAALGSINEDIVDQIEIAIHTIELLQNLYPGLLEQIYEGDGCNAHDMLNAIAVKRGLLKAGGEADRKRAAITFLHELRRGQLGRLSLEKPNS